MVVLVFSLPASAFSANVVECIEHEQGVRKLIGGLSSEFGIVQEFHQRADVVTAQHGAEQFYGIKLGNEGRFALLTMASAERKPALT